MSMIIVAALYQFTPLPDFAERQPALKVCCLEAGTMGTLLLAAEGINGTIAGSREAIDRVLAHIRAIPGCENLDVKESSAAQMPFYRMKVRLKKEIVTMGIAPLDAAREAGKYVDPADWNELISDPQVTVIDTRNDYEVETGSFTGALDPHTGSFRDFPKWADEKLGNMPKTAPIAMFCTGGIRCEKATAYLRSRGFENVYHLKGGILKYLETVPQKDSLWQGECFVFDQRVTVSHGLKQGSYDQCYACRRPITAADKASADYRKGVSCPRCIGEFSDESRRRFHVRQQQIERGDIQLGRPQTLVKQT